MIMIMSNTLVDRLLAMPGVEMRLRAGAAVFRRDDPVRQIFIVRQGGAHLRRHGPNGGAIALQRAGPGAILAEASLFSARYHCDALALGATRLHAIRKSLVVRQWREDPEFAELFAGHLAREVQQARLRAEILAQRRVSERLDAWLAWNNGALPAKGAWHMVAMEIGVSAEALYRELARRNRRFRRGR
jgi:CRP-like cAMP-binding protein